VLGWRLGPRAGILGTVEWSGACEVEVGREGLGAEVDVGLLCMYTSLTRISMWKLEVSKVVW
jgi:hypothetical protein